MAQPTDKDPYGLKTEIQHHKRQETQIQDLARKPQTQWQIVRRELWKNKAAMMGLAVLIIFVILGVLAPVIAPYDPIEMNPKAQFCEPTFQGELLGWDANDNEVYAFPHIMGCDEYGRDLFSRVLHGLSLIHI